MRQYIPVITLAMLVALAAAALSGGLLPAGNAVHAADPEFDITPDPGSRSVPENTPPGVNIGAPISATDADEGDLEFGDTLTYSLEATADAEAAAFDIDKSTGQLITKAALHYDGDNAKTRYDVTVRVKDSSGGEGRTQTVTINVDDVDEPPAAPMAPTVVSGEDDDPSDDDEHSTTRLKVVWHAPENTGPAITDYHVQYKKSTDTSFTDWSHSGTSTTTTINPQDGLKPDTSYQVRVRATNGEGNNDAPWSFVGTGSTNKEGNSPPQSTDEPPVERNVVENTSAGENVGNPVTATDGDTTTLTYQLGGPDADLFNFDTRSGQIRTKAPLNHEDPRCYDDTKQPHDMPLLRHGRCC